MHILKYKRYPNNEIRAVHYYRAPSRKTQPTDEPSPEDVSCSDAAPSVEPGSSEATVPPLDISDDFPQSSVSNPHRRTQFGRKAKNTILRMGGALDTIDSTPSNYVFLTGTIPGGTHDAFMAMAIDSPKITASIADWLRRTTPTDYWFYVWELQRRGALHIHYCVHCPNPNIRQKLLSSWKPKWEALLSETGRRTSTDMWIRKDGTYHKEGHSVLQAYAQEVSKSVCAYMAGYCSDTKNKHAMDAHNPFYPKRWWGASRKLTNLLQGLTEEVVIEHTNYKDAHHEMLQYYETVLSDTPTAYRYKHKVGIGSTVVSYHPEDKGDKLWQELNPVLYKTTTHPNTASTIAHYRNLCLQTQCFLAASPKLVQNSYRPLLTTLEALCFPAPVYGFSISRADIALALSIESSLDSMLNSVSGWEKLRIHWCWLQDSFQAVLPKLTSDKHGYLCQDNDILKLLDNHWTERYRSTTTVKTEGAKGEAAHGSLSPRNLPSLQLPLFR